jgi:hypothetical protein
VGPIPSGHSVVSSPDPTPKRGRRGLGTKLGIHMWLSQSIPYCIVLLGYQNWLDMAGFKYKWEKLIFNWYIWPSSTIHCAQISTSGIVVSSNLSHGPLECTTCSSHALNIEPQSGLPYHACNFLSSCEAKLATFYHKNVTSHNCFLLPGNPCSPA